MRATLHTWLGVVWRTGGLADLGQLRGQMVVQPHLLVQNRDQQVRPVDLPKGMDKRQDVYIMCDYYRERLATYPRCKYIALVLDIVAGAKIIEASHRLVNVDQARRRASLGMHGSLSYSRQLPCTPATPERE
jgi:hypothetical protein